MRPRGLRDISAAKESPLRQSGGQSMARVRSLRDVQAAEEITSRAVPTTHTQRFAEISWLEREAERLQREASVLEATRLRLQNRLTEISERRAFLLGLVRESLMINGQDPAAAQSSTPKVKENERERGFETFALEY